MKLTVLSKMLITAGFMAALSAAIVPTITKTAQAQNQDQLQTKMLSPAEVVAQSEACDRVFKELGETIDGQTFFDDFRGLNLTEQQRKAYDALDAQAEAKRAEVYKGSISIADPDATLAFSGLMEGSAPPDIQAAIQEALNGNPKMDQEAALNQKFGKYGLFYGFYITYLTLGQERQLDQITADFYSQVQALMTPEQQPQYQKNLASRLKINAVCDQKAPFPSYPALGQIRDKLPATN